MKISKISHLTYFPKSGLYGDHPCIKVDGVEYDIEDVNQFYNVLGYSNDLAKTGILPDEFIWEEYVKDATANHTARLQKLLLNYLFKNSSSFRQRYNEMSEGIFTYE